MNYINPSPESGKQFYMDFHQKGPIVMLNMLSYRKVADYSTFEDIKPENEISGQAAYNVYMKHTMPHLAKAGGKVIFFGKSKHFLIGPQDEKWDAVLLVEHQSVDKFMEFARNEAYLKTSGHRSAALADSRLLPMSQVNLNL